MSFLFTEIMLLEYHFIFCVFCRTDTHSTCPICRAKCKSSADAWELTDAPDSTEFKSEVCEVLVGIADRKSRREQT